MPLSLVVRSFRDLSAVTVPAQRQKVCERIRTSRSFVRRLHCTAPRGACQETTTIRSTIFDSIAVLFRPLAFGQLLLPLVHEGPVDGAGPKVGHVEIAFEPVDGFVEQGVVLAKIRAMAGKEPFHVALADAAE